MLLLQDVLQVRLLVVAYLAHVRVEAGLPGAVANFAGELGEILGLELAAVDPLQPALAAHLAQVGGHRLVVDLRPDAVRIDSGWNCTAHRPASWSSIAITTPSAVAAVTANPPRTSPAGAYRLWYLPAVNSAGSPASSEPPFTRTRPGLPCAGSGSRDSAPPACSTIACRPRQTPKVGRCRAYTSSSSAAQPKSAGRPGPGDMTTRSGA